MATATASLCCMLPIKLDADELKAARFCCELVLTSRFGLADDDETIVLVELFLCK